MGARHDFHGDPDRFPVLADFIYEHFGHTVRYVADVAGGQGMLSRILRKRNYDAEVIDPRGWRLRGVPGRETFFDSTSADYYDLVVGLHPDGATQAVVKSALTTRTLIVPCCNFWDRSRRLGTMELISDIEAFFARYGVLYERVILPLNTPKKVALVTTPPTTPVDLMSVCLPSLERSSTFESEPSRWDRVKARSRRNRTN